MSDQCSHFESDQPDVLTNFGLFYWSTVWLGMTAGSGLGGSLVGGIEGILFGLIFTGIAAFAVCMIGAILTQIIRPRFISPIIIGIVGSLSSLMLPLAGAVYFSRPALFGAAMPICIITGIASAITARLLNSTQARWNRSPKENGNWRDLLVVLLVGGLLSVVSIPCLLGQGERVWNIAEPCLCALGCATSLLLIIPLFFVMVFYTTAVACRCAPIVKWTWFLAGLLFLLSIFTPPVKYCITAQKWSREHESVRAKVDLFEKQKPESVDAVQWESAVGWTHNLIGNVYFSPKEHQVESLRRLNRDLDEKLHDPVNLSTLRWIWDRVEADNPDSNYAVRFWDDRVFAEKPIDDSSLPELRSLDKRPCIDLYDLNITDAGLVHLANLPRLTWLGLANTKITDEGVKILAKMKNLKTLNLKGTKVTQKGIDYLQKELPACKIEYESNKSN